MPLLEYAVHSLDIIHVLDVSSSFRLTFGSSLVSGSTALLFAWSVCLLDDSVVHVTIFVHILGLVHILGYVYAGMKYCPRVIYRLLRVSPPRASLPSCIVIGLHPSRYRPESPSVLPRFSIARVITAILHLSVSVELSISLSSRVVPGFSACQLRRIARP